ncbi:MAG: DUF3122 domain-containing protein [Oscillatoriales cyanobacterium RM2_1_1]|nr:DUF3122 domain-containing protein [Oscillatoriales cyanobacterium SM2_3_0]NJO47691.1 DUF3122 domain-containing protein [Oscillatoriales cyanobacterium RM2_1_1]
MTTLPAGAAINQHQQASGEILYKSHHRLKDKQGQSWQVIVFKSVDQGKVTNASLRIVGFPGLAQFDHQEPLKIVTKTGDSFGAVDRFAEQAPADNVAQYDLQAILKQLPLAEPVDLIFSMESSRRVELQVPSAMVLEWQVMASQS